MSIFSILFGKKSEVVDTRGKISPLVLLVLDGWGVAPPSAGNAIALAGTPVMDKILATYPNGKLIASGEGVGLPASEVGNTEVGHLTIGAGRVIYQGLKRINMAIEDRSFFENDAFVKAINYAKQYKSNIHLMGIIGAGQVHASPDHLFAIMQLMKNHEFNRVYLHLFTDGRDSPPRDALNLLTNVKAKIRELGVGEVATISGRYYAMDRDRRWERTQKAYQAIVESVGQYANSADDAIKNAYSLNRTDEFIEPTVILKDKKPVAKISDNDVVIFYNYRIDRPRQLTMALTMPEFENLKSFEFGHSSEGFADGGKVNFGSTFKRKLFPKSLFFVTMTQYQENIPVSAVAFPPLPVADPLGYVLSTKGITQMHMAESEKERFVTYYFDGLKDQPFPGEEYLIVPSPKVPTYDRKPEMSVHKLVEEFKKVVNQSKFQFIVMNIANPDMVAHSGNLQATIKAIKIVDKAVGEIVDHVLSFNGTILITGDHGNAEELITYPRTSFFFTSSQGSTNTDHSNNPVPLIIINSNLAGRKIDLPGGSLADIAPTILGMMKITQPQTMTGRNLLTNNG